MTTLNEATEAVYQRFVTNFTGTSNVVFRNEEPTFDPETVSTWVRLSVGTLARAQETLGRVGNRKYRPSASVVVQVYTRANTGVKQGETLAEEAKDVFEGTSFSGLDFNNGIVRNGPIEGKWQQHVAEVEFDYEEIK